MNDFNFLNLTSAIREKMLLEVNQDIKLNKLYISDRLNIHGKKIYTNILINCIKNGNEIDFEKNLCSGNYFNQSEYRKEKQVKVPSNAPKLLAQSEFNRFYIRAICLQAIEDGSNEVEIYRARESSWSRSESEMKIGSKIEANILLDDLRSNIGQEPKILPEVNSGLSIKLI
ncbi:MAG: hypothetical protein PF487_09405 [Bacteroidales bacterium]|jgi:hypothetical protein|nr:hypothetical protein [Bacteroidales bacterium]